MNDASLTRSVPVLPESAPFTPEQRAYLNGFLAGLFSHAPVGSPAASPAIPQAIRPLTILFGSQTGNAERLAKRVSRDAAKLGFAPTLHELCKYPPEQLAADKAILVVTSTYGDGEPPDNARAFWTALQRDIIPRLEMTRFSICSLGDSNYPRFCQFGRDLDARLESLGARRVHPRQDCDVEFDRPFQTWLEGALAALSGEATEPGPPASDNGPRVAKPESIAENHSDSPSHSIPWSRANPFPARLKTNRRLSRDGSARDVRHFEIELGDSGLTYEPGDAIGAWPANCPALVDAVLDELGRDGEEAVPGRGEGMVPLRLALLHHYELRRISPECVRHFAEGTGDSTLRRLTSPEANGELQHFLHGRDILDLLKLQPGIKPAPSEFIRLLRKLQPRLYSISSSLKAHPGEVHLTVSAVRYEAYQRQRTGVASCFLADRAGATTPVPVFIHPNRAFRPPEPGVPVIMIGPGTGIAPFRAFLEERRAVGAGGRSWLFFGGQHRNTDFLYEEEIHAFQRDGVLTRLDLAWSRDQHARIYVQQRMLESGPEIWSWLEEGAAIYICGDATRMAKDVEVTLHRIIESAGGRSNEAAAEYLESLKRARRYQRDVY
jgi:sulfite reductase (NADPH) flavoprotein alpha-component